MSFEHDEPSVEILMPIMEDYASRAAVIIEIGCGNGNGSTRAFARGLARSPKLSRLHIGVDILNVRPEVKPENFWQEVHGASEDPATAHQVGVILGGRKADLIFIDTVHTGEQMSQELPIWEQFSDERTIWMLHDSWMFGPYNGSMCPPIEKYAQEHGLEFIHLSKESHGLSILRKPNVR